jgi:hypothetical protein
MYNLRRNSNFRAKDNQYLLSPGVTMTKQIHHHSIVLGYVGSAVCVPFGSSD